MRRAAVIRRFPRSLEVGAFLEDHWQKQPYLERSVTGGELPELDPDEVAWLATQPDVESRLVLTTRRQDRVAYVLESGPFDAERLAALPGADWTLLVQDVDKHLPDFRAYFDLVPWVPDWRIDDLMVSVAAPGGGVGPHVDSYDVFLVQGAGRREWRLGDPARVREDPSAEALALLLPFEPVRRLDVAHGDVLYLPPGLPHWGIATTLCTTWSIGLRAPTARELAAGADRVLAPPAAMARADRFYADPDLGVGEGEPGMISRAAVERLRTQALLDRALPEDDLALVLGSVTTDPKAWLMPEPADSVAAASVVHGMARLAWYDSGPLQLVFVNGAGRRVDRRCLGAFRDCCRTRTAGPALMALAADDEGAAFVEWLRANGLFDDGRERGQEPFPGGQDAKT